MVNKNKRRWGNQSPHPGDCLLKAVYFSLINSVNPANNQGGRCYYYIYLYRGSERLTDLSRVTQSQTFNRVCLTQKLTTLPHTGIFQRKNASLLSMNTHCWGKVVTKEVFNQPCLWIHLFNNTLALLWSRHGCILQEGLWIETKGRLQCRSPASKCEYEM